NNYFIGSDRTKWHGDVPNFSKLTYKNVWKGIDVEYYGADDGDHLQDGLHLEYNIIVAPGADPNRIAFAYKGDDGVRISEDGSLVIKTSVGDVAEGKPYAYQIINGVKKEIPSSFRIDGSANISFSLGEYDPAQELIIDPVYSTYLGNGAY